MTMSRIEIKPGSEGGHTFNGPITRYWDQRGVGQTKSQKSMIYVWQIISG